MINTNFIEFEIKPEVDHYDYDDNLTVYRKEYTPNVIDFCIFNMDFKMTKEVALGLANYIKDRVNDTN